MPVSRTTLPSRPKVTAAHSGAGESIEIGPNDAHDLELALGSSMQRLQAACDARGRADRVLETASCNLAWRIARLILDADLANVRLPRGYVARSRSSEAYLEKYSAGSNAPESEDAPSEPSLVLTRKDSIVARMEPAARKLSYDQILEFKRDLEEGLIEEIATFIETFSAHESEAAAWLNRLLAQPETATDTRLAQLGRRKRTA